MIVLTNSALSWNFIPPLNIATLKEIVKQETKCIDLNIKYGKLIGETSTKKLIKTKELENYKYSTNYGLFNPSMFGDYFSIDYPLYLLKQNNDDIDKKMNSIFDDMTKDILKENPEIIGFTTWRESLPIAMNIAKRLKKEGIKIMFGGPGVRWCSEYLLKYPFVDGVCLGEGEYVINDMIDSIEKNEKKKIWISERFANINDNPIPNYDDFDMNKYKAIGIETQRGCVNKCVFCSFRAYHNTEAFRMKSIEKIICEIKILKEKYGNNYFHFSDNIINGTEERVRELKNFNDLDITWGGECFPDINKEDAQIMKKSGCVHTELGCESLSNNLLKKMGKNNSYGNIFKTAKNLYENDINSKGMFFFGFPSETITDILITMFRMNKLLKYFYEVGIGYYHLNPGSLISREPEKYNIKFKKTDEEWIAFHDRIPFEQDNSKIKRFKFELIEFFNEYLNNMGKIKHYKRWGELGTL